MFLRVALALAGVAATTVAAHWAGANTATAGFAFLLLVLALATTQGFPAALAASCGATVAYNYFFLPPVGTLTIADPENWVALVSFLSTSLIGARLSAQSERRAIEAIERQQDVERLYTFSRAILLIDAGEPFAKQLAARVAEVFGFEAVVLYDRRSDELFRAGPLEFDGLDEQIRDSARLGNTYNDPERRRVVTAIRLGSDPIASIAVQGGRRMQDSVLQGMANLVAIGLERARSEEMARQMEAARQSEQLRTAMIDAMAHEFKTPLTAVKAATTSMLANLAMPVEAREEMLRVADEEADHLKELIDDSVEMARLDGGGIELRREMTEPEEIIRETLSEMRPRLGAHVVEVVASGHTPVRADRRLMKLAFRQLVENAAKYSPADQPITVAIGDASGGCQVTVTDRGPGIAKTELRRIFERFYRGKMVRHQIPGTGLGLAIAAGILKAHEGELTVRSEPGETVFTMWFPGVAA